MDITRSGMGRTGDGMIATAYTLEAGRFRASFSDFGARWLSFEVPEGKGRPFPTSSLAALTSPDTKASDAYFGANCRTVRKTA